MALADLSPVLQRSLLRTIDKGESSVPVNVTNQLTRIGLDLAGEIIIQASDGGEMSLSDEEMDSIADDYFDKLFASVEDDSIDLLNPRSGKSNRVKFKATGSAGYAARYRDKQGRSISALNLVRLLNTAMDKYVKKAMSTVPGSLTYRTGRFSGSVVVEEIKSNKPTQGTSGSTSLFFNYMVAPYSVFDPAIATNQVAQYPTSYDPRVVIRTAIDEALRDILHSSVFTTEVFRKYMRT